MTPGPAAPGHSRPVNRDADRRLLAVALALIVGFMAVEVVVGLLAGSLALLADAAHMLTDAVAVALAMVAIRVAGRPATGAYTYGLRRVEILSAHANGLSLLALAVFFVVEAARRLMHPPGVDGAAMLGVALAGVTVNFTATWVLSKADRSSLNIEGSFQHIVTDLYAFLGTAVAAVVILLTGWDRADAIASLGVAALMTLAGIRLVGASGRIFLEAAPRGLDATSVKAGVLSLPGVRDVHDLHLWEVTSGFPALSAHVLVGDDEDCHTSRLAIERMLADRFAISHTTLQVDHQQTSLSSPTRRGDAPPAARHPGHAEPGSTAARPPNSGR